MRIVSTASWHGLQEYAFRWFESLPRWPSGTEAVWYTESYEAPPAPDDFDGTLTVRDFSQLKEFCDWKLRHAFYIPPSWRWDVVKYAHKVFAACDALADYDGIAAWVDGDCVTFKDVPAGLLEAEVADDYIAHYARTGHYTETGLWIMNCAHPEHKNFLRTWQGWYFSGKYRQLFEWHDCCTLDATIAKYVAEDKITARNLSGEFAKDMHPQSKTPLGAYIDHCKGPRKIEGRSRENKNRQAA